LAVFAAYLCLTAIAETHQAWALVFPNYVGSPEVREFLGRGRGPFLNPAANGIVQVVGLCAALMAWPRLNRPGKLLLLATLPLYAWGIYSTLTRSVWMGAGLALLIVMALVTPRSWRLAVLGTAMLASVAIVAASWEHVGAFKRDKDVSVEDVAESAKLRPILAAVAWRMFLDRPLLGCGYGQYSQESAPYFADRTIDLPLEKARPYVQHNVLLALLTETGLLGMGLFVALLASWTRTAWRLWRTQSAPLWARQMGLLFLTFLCAYLTNGMFHDVSIFSTVNMLLFFLAGAIMGLTPWLAVETSTERLRVWLPDEELAAIS
jgi:O-antigen ligase